MPDWWVSLGEALMESELRPSELRPRSFTLTDAEREAILFCVSCAQDYRDTLDGSEERAKQMIEIAMRLAMPKVGPAPVEGPRTASVTDVGGAGPTLTVAEREALEIAVEYVGSAYAVEHHARTIERLLERTRGAV
jgi:hypothetical protein